ncbi:MAG: hypothetical protein A2939_02880 [Parcubacteria group bacterium RIFCSPLOWO2_01_FULL_48_18]|nr:MAG: hypothetical protein A2939_02880 [Parcubacteria group bacterium RIFCSPLOWO2_01_FULL_48_18]
MSSDEIRKRFLEYFEKRGHIIVPSSSLIPDDPSVLLTTAGMQQFKPYYGELDPMTTVHPSIGRPVGENVASVQRCFRTSDIDEVGDESHLTFFEMLGNFSFGGYFKKEAIRYGYDFVVNEMKLPIEYVTIFDPARVPGGDWRKEGVPFDQESYDIWKNEIGLSEEKIKREGVDNFWGPTGNEGPCGPTTELYVRSVDGKDIEVWNIVFNEFYCDKNRKLMRLKTPGVDTGMGLERLAMVVQKVPTIFETDLFVPLMAFIPEAMPTDRKLIFADHARGSAFLISDGVRPSNKEAGYILRRLLRRIIVHMYLEQNPGFDFRKLFETVVRNYKDFYPELDHETTVSVFEEENRKFRKTIANGLRELKKMPLVDGKSAFRLYETFGIPYEIIKELSDDKGKNLRREDFDKEFKRHQEISRAGQERKFGGHGLLLDTGELKAGNEEELKKVTRLHTATHLLHQALRDVLGNSVRQMGSDITVERTRFDYTLDRKMTPEEIKKVEAIVDEKVSAGLPVSFKELPLREAEKTGALHFFKAKYPSLVKVYYIGDSIEKAYSKEFCGGPHVNNTAEIGRVKILKDEASSAGVRRIRAAVD